MNVFSEYYMTFFNAERKRQKKTVTEISRETGIASTTISNWTCGKSFPSLEGFCIALDALGYQLDISKKK